MYLSGRHVDMRHHPPSGENKFAIHCQLYYWVGKKRSGIVWPSARCVRLAYRSKFRTFPHRHTRVDELTQRVLYCAYLRNSIHADVPKFSLAVQKWMYLLQIQSA